MVKSIRMDFSLWLLNIFVLSVFTLQCRAGNPSIHQQIQWLKSQQNSQTGLLRSYDMPGDYTAWTYDQAVGILAFLAADDPNAAMVCADGMMSLARDPNQWVDGYDSVDGCEVAKSVAVGPNAWMGLAMLKLYQATNNPKYLSAAEDIAGFVINLQRQDGPGEGSVRGGYDINGVPFSWTSTEHNADALAFLCGLSQITENQNYYTASVKIAQWLDRQMWNPDSGCYETGYGNDPNTISEFPERLDSQSWVLLALQTLVQGEVVDPNISELIHNGLPWIDSYLCQVDYADCALSGFSKITLGESATDSFWGEGTAGYYLAAGAGCHNKSNQNITLESLRCLQKPDGSVPYSVGISFPEINEQFDPNDIIVAHFEAHPNYLYGQVGVHGDGEPNWASIIPAGYQEPYSWYYELAKPGYDANNVHTGVQSFRLVNATDMCASQGRGWASMGVDLGPRMEGEVESRDVSEYAKFSFWAKTPDPNGANIKVIFNAISDSNEPQFSIIPNPPVLENQWTRHTVMLSDPLLNGLDLTQLVHVGFAFGALVNNSPGTIIYVDDLAFTGSGKKTPLSNGDQMPSVYPQHWPYGSVASAGWSVFTELGVNPFDAVSVHPLKPCLVPLGDLSADCRINVDDLVIFSEQWLQSGMNSPADLAPSGGDGLIDLEDLSILTSRWLVYGH